MLVDETLLLEHIQKIGKKQKIGELKKDLEIKGEDELKAFEKALKSLEYSGEIYLDEKGFYQLFDDQLPLKQGIIHITREGYGYVNVPKNGKMINYMIYPKDLNGALPKDLVIIRPRNRQFLGHQIAVVEKILKRDKFLEIFEYQDDGTFIPYEVQSKFKVLTGKNKGLVPGSLVLLEVGEDVYKFEKDDNLYFLGGVKKVIGHKDDPKIDELAICMKHGFDHRFSTKVMKAVDKIPTSVTEEDILGRVDLRDKNIFTIDGADTKDIDDAISIEKDGEDFILSVHIADVSHYIYPYPELIKEVILRGNSAYVADSVIPMLPHILSNGICSLNPDKDRLTKTVEMRFNKEGKLIDYNIYKSVIRSHKKMTYDEVNLLLEKGIIVDGYESFSQDLLEMKKLSALITKNRRKKGCLVFEDAEVKIYTDNEGLPIMIKRQFQKTGERLIENFMIMANMVVTENYGYLNQPFIYRVHEAPDLIKLKAALEVLASQEVIDTDKMKTLLDKVNSLIEHHGELKPCDLQPILLDADDNDNLLAISNLLLRSMKKAIYSNQNIGHFGIAEDSYCHFTSPIRRAADLLNHIIIDLHLQMQKAQSIDEIMDIQQILNEIERKLEEICEHITQMEIAAFNAEKEIEEIKMIKYVAANIDDYMGPVAAQICQTSKMGLGLLVDDKIRATINNVDLNSLGFDYMRDSRSYVRGKADKFKLGGHLYVFDPEVSVPHRTICFHMPMTSDDYQKSLEEKPKKLIKSRNLKGL